MICDFDDCEWRQLDCDLCIIGAGAAGIALAREFLNSSHSVVVLEGGGSEFETASQEPYQSEVTGLPHKGVHEGRARAIGGTTTLWAGQALPLFDIDFQKREWVPLSGWPITRQQLKPFYRRAEDVMQIPHASYDERSWPRRQQPSAVDAVQAYYSQFAQVPSFVTKYRRELATATNVTVITHANVVELQANEAVDSIRAVSLKSFNGKIATVRAKFFAICCGGIDTARLLLASNQLDHAGIGNRTGMVGRCFQDHPTIKVPFTPRDAKAFDQVYSAVRTKSSLNIIKLVPSAAYQRDNEILNVGAEVVHEDDDVDPVAAAFRCASNLARFRINQDILNEFVLALKSPCAVSAAFTRKLFGRRGRSAASLQHYLMLSSEQEPDPDSRISLSDEVDSLGMPRAIVHWKLTRLVSHTMDTFVRHLAKQWQTLGLADIDLSTTQIIGRETSDHGGYSDMNHHIGTTRMGIDRTTSVVDPACRVHGYQNLYIASSSVFPTGGFSNPTLTVLALSCRMADTLKLALSNNVERYNSVEAVGGNVE